jgi:ankyrin repeat protein
MTKHTRAFNARAADAAEFLEAATRGNEARVLELLAKGVDIDTRDEEGNSALDKAIWSSKKSMTLLLLEKGADPNAEDHNGRTPLMTAVLIHHLDLAEALIAKGAKIDHISKDGHTPLMEAAWAGDMPCVQMLLGKGAYTLTQTPFNQDAFMIAHDQGWPKVADVIMHTMKTRDWPEVERKYRARTQAPSA